MLMNRKRPPPFSSALTSDGILSAMHQSNIDGPTGDKNQRSKVAEPTNQASNYDNHAQKFIRKKPRAEEEEEDGGFGFGGSAQNQFGNYAQGHEEDDGELRTDNTGFNEQRAHPEQTVPKNLQAQQAGAGFNPPKTNTDTFWGSENQGGDRATQQFAGTFGQQSDPNTNFGQAPGFALQQQHPGNAQQQSFQTAPVQQQSQLVQSQPGPAFDMFKEEYGQAQ